MNIHDRPFTYYRNCFLAERLEEVTQVKAAELFDPQAFRKLSSEIRKKADDILRRDFDVRGTGHWRNTSVIPTPPCSWET